ncbi:hypothetical protein KVP09_14220 [Alcaligenaceae bacterium CGII-47]|nr:hypothetical protein [Alcaligenaceae bacterium CGII-47]
MLDLPPLLEPLIFSVPQASVFFFFNLGLSLATMLVALRLFYVDRSLLIRPAYYCSVGWLLLYQIPLSIFSSEFSVSLVHVWKWSFMIHMIGLFLLGWCALISERSKSDMKRQSIVFTFPALGLAERWLPFSFLLLMVGIYFYVVPYDCTGLYALWADPWMTLLAREFSVKLIGSSLATYALGAAANIISPLATVFSIFYAKRLLLQRRYIYSALWLSIGVLAVVLVLTSGAKGLLLPTLIMTSISALLWGDGWVSRVVMLTAAIGLISLTMVSFELARERDGIAGARYDFAQCTVETRTCSQSTTLVRSLGYREGSLGLSNRLIEQIGNRLSCMCSSQGDAGQCPTVGVPAYRPKEAGRAATVAGRAATVAARASTLFQAILNRAFGVPFQVGAWHLMYSETEHVDGWETLPFSRRIFGRSLNMPELVYQKYGTVYSKGDRTSTSTAPTSFLLAYTSYLGLTGFLIALGCLIAWDFIYTALVLRVRRELWPIAAGMAAITSMNFMSSDFVTVLISHGGVASVMVIISFILLRRFSRASSDRAG